MSILGNQLLEKVLELQPDNAAAILDKLTQKVLKNKAHDTHDGMNVALCNIDKQINSINFAGAQRPLIIINNTGNDEIKGVSKSIGEDQINKRQFIDYTLKIQPENSYYIFSDGFQDQFGGDNGKKFMKRSLIKLLEDVHSHPLELQKSIINQTFEDWKVRGNEDQTDDVLLIGFKPGTF